MVLENVRKAYLKRKLKSVRGKRRAAFEREISKIESKQAFERQTKQIQEQAFREEKIKQAAQLGKERAKIQTQRKLKALRETGGSGKLAAFDKFLAGTGVAKGTAPVIRKSSPKQKVDVIGGAGGFNPVTGNKKKGGGFNIV